MPDWQLRTPVAFILFNRPDVTERVFTEIAKAKPHKLLVIGDGPRADRAGEAGKVAETRQILERIDWDCAVLTNFSDINLGCKRRVSGGLDWVFEQTPEAIILEDDCVPHPSFFRFCEEMLERYRDDRRVVQINGANFQSGFRAGNQDSYYFSKLCHVWGWASWRDRWQSYYDVSMAAWPRVRDERRVADLVGSDEETKYWLPIFQDVFDGKIDTWDFQWAFACMLEGGSAVAPSVNLVSNIGFGAGATHTTGGRNRLANLPTEPMRFPLRHPAGMFQSRSLDRRFFRRFSSASWRSRITTRLRRHMHESSMAK
jgi:hypothetical protein